MPYLLCYETSLTLLKLRRNGFHISRYGYVFNECIHRIFRNGWMDCRDAVLCLYCCGTNKAYIAEYEAYWHMAVPKNNSWGARFTSIFSVFSAMVGWIAELLFMLFFVYIAV